jgi:Fe-S cluster assembly protein SufD
MLGLMEEKDTYLSSFNRLEKELAGRLAWLAPVRHKAIERFSELGFPTTRHEDWRFTNLAPLRKMSFRPAPITSGPGADRIREAVFAAADHVVLAFVNGRYRPELSSRRGLPEGVSAGSLGALDSKAHPWIVAHLARHAGFADQPFTALNTAFIDDGAVLRVPKGVAIDVPIQIVYVSDSAGGPTVSYPRSLIIAGAASSVTVVESYVGLGDDPYFTNCVTEIVVEEDAEVDHYKLQLEGQAAFHIGTLQVHQDQGSRFSSHFIGMGSALARNQVRALLDAEGVECTLNGLYMASGQQHMDNATVIDHAKPHGTSHELYKGILDDQARGVFNGKIFVRQDAQKTDAKQTNKTLLLSDDATINTKPQLEIYADDVKCTHGATVGQLEEEALFYLRSRGIGPEEARGLLTFAFANDIIGRIRVESLRQGLESTLLARQRL